MGKTDLESMAQFGSLLLIYGLLLALLGCEGAPSVSDAKTLDKNVLTFYTPANNSVIDRGNSVSIAVSGTCGDEGAPVSVTTTSISQLTTCTNSAWSTTLNMYSLGDGNYTILASNSFYTASTNIKIQTTTPQVIFTKPTAPSGIFGDSFNFNWVTVGSLRATNAFYVEAFANSSCTGTPMIDGMQNALSFSSAGLMAGTYYSVRVRPYSPTDVEGTPVCSSAVLPQSTLPTLLVNDGTTLFTTFVRQVTAKTTITSPAITKKWCLTEAFSTPPISTDTCFKSTKPTSFIVSVGDATKTIYLWIQDVYGGIMQSTVSSTITLDTVKPATPTIVITDPVSLSTTQTSQALNDLAITNDTDAAAWCLIDTSSTASAPIVNFSNACFSAVKPTTITLSARGPRKVYLFTKDLAGNVSTAGMISFNYLAASTFTISSDSGHSHPGACIPVEFTLRDTNGSEVPAGPAAFSIAVSETATGSLYTTAECITTTSILNVPIGSSRGKVYYKTGVVENAPIVAAPSSTPTATVSYTVPVTSRNAFSLGENGHSCIVYAGDVQCWGLNNSTFFGQTLVPETDLYLPTGKRITSMTQVSDISVGGSHVCGIKGGKAYCWGMNDYGQLGIGANINRTIPTLLTLPVVNVYELAAGKQHTCAAASGKVYCWGRGDLNQLGNGSSLASNSPQLVTGMTADYYRVGAGDNFNCALKNGKLQCWGDNLRNQLGNGSNAPTLTPTDVLNLNTGVTDFSLAADWGCAIKNGALYCWGTNNEAGLGQGFFTSSTPLAVTGASANVTKISVGKSHACFIMSGVLNCWGQKNLGQFGDGTTTPTTVTAPVSITAVDVSFNGSGRIAQIEVGQQTTCGIGIGAEYKCWGSNANSAVGIGTFNSSAIPVTVTVPGTPVEVSTGPTTCARTSSGVYCWGQGDGHQIITSTSNTLNQSSPVLTTVGVSQSLAMGSYGACSVTSNAIKCWGLNVDLVAGIDVDYDFSDVTQIENIDPVASPATQVDVSRSGSHACAVVNGGVYCWGNAGAGRLGNAIDNPNEDPTLVASFPELPAATDPVLKVVVGRAHSCALLTSGAVKCWGDNSDYQLGDGTQVSTPGVMATPIPSGATDISASNGYTCAVVSGELQCWGFATTNILPGGFVDVPTPHVDLTSGVSKVTTSPFNVCVIKTDLTVRCFGSSADGRLGDNMVGTSGMASVQVTGITSATSISSSTSHTCAVDGSLVKCWGVSLWGALGGSNFVVSTPQSPVLE